METLQKRTLYNIRQDHYELLQMIEDAEGELTPEIEVALQLNEESFNDKAVSYGYVIKGFENTEEIIDREIARLQELKDKSVKRQELFKNILSEAMQQFGVVKIETATLKLSFRKSEAVNIVDEKKVPAEFLDFHPATYTVSKSKIKETLKRGIDVKGAELVTRQNLQIK